jgi:hypothetical protein
MSSAREPEGPQLKKLLATLEHTSSFRYIFETAEYASSLVSTPTWWIQARDRPIDLANHRRAAAEGDRVEGRSGGLGGLGLVGGKGR